MKSDATLPGQDPVRPRAPALALGAARYVGAYLLGIVACLASTPASIELAGAALWPWYPVFAPIAFFLFYFYLPDGYLPSGGAGVAFLIWSSIGLLPLAGEIAAHIRHSLRPWRPLWIGFPIGFVGALGVYYVAASSV